LTLLAHKFNESAQYAKLDGRDVVYLARIEPPDQRIRLAWGIGERNPAHLTGVGKALLAYHLKDDAQVEEFVRQNGLEGRTPASLVTAAALAKELRLTRQRGFALDRGECYEDIVCIAFPLYLDSPSTPTGALSIAALNHRRPVDALIASYDEISDLIRRELGDVLPAPSADGSISVTRGR
jgi:DNA-binding IclR family transcriptional regulator